jgi:hypothetical protein
VLVQPGLAGAERRGDAVALLGAEHDRVTGRAGAAGRVAVRLQVAGDVAVGFAVVVAQLGRDGGALGLEVGQGGGDLRTGAVAGQVDRGHDGGVDVAEPLVQLGFGAGHGDAPFRC